MMRHSFRPLKNHKTAHCTVLFVLHFKGRDHGYLIFSTLLAFNVFIITCWPLEICFTFANITVHRESPLENIDIITPQGAEASEASGGPSRV